MRIPSEPPKGQDREIRDLKGESVLTTSKVGFLLSQQAYSSTTNPQSKTFDFFFYIWIFFIYIWMVKRGPDSRKIEGEFCEENGR